MTGSRAAIRYAKAILEMAQAAGNAEQVNSDMAQIANTVKENKELFEIKRFEILEQVAVQYGIQFDELNGREESVVTTAFPITPELEAKVLEKAKILSDKELVLHNIVDPAIIGGFILRVGDKQFNASVANSLTTLKRELSN